jgi:hypothetical protein
LAYNIYENERKNGSKHKQHIGLKAFAKSKEAVLKMLEGTEFYPDSCGNFREIMQEIEAGDAETSKPQNLKTPKWRKARFD